MERLQIPAFTMAEILLSLTIIGVVAAITLPSLTGNINERTWNTQRKALYARMSQAISLMPALNGFGKFEVGTNSAGSAEITEDTATETFITNGLSKVLKINNICGNDNLKDCGMAEKYTTFAGSTIELSSLQYLDGYISNIAQGLDSYPEDTIRAIKSAAFETQNGESIIAYYNPYCNGNFNFNSVVRRSDGTYEQTTFPDFRISTCVNFIYDLNGSKGPNTVGKDVGIMAVLGPTDSIVTAPYPLARALSQTYPANEANSACRQQDPDSRVPNCAELATILLNLRLYNNGFIDTWCSDKTPQGDAINSIAAQHFESGANNGSIPAGVHCVKRF